MPEFFVINDGSIVDEVVVMSLIEVWMSIMRRFATTGCPSSMANTYKTSLMVF